MPRFYFDIRDGDLIRDDTGLELASAQAARTEAIRALPDVARDDLPDGDERVFSVSVRNAGGRTIFGATLTLHCSRLDSAS